MKNSVGMGAAEIKKGISEGTFSVSDVVSSHINRIKAVNGDLNAVIWPRFDEALDEAKKADEKIRKGENHGSLFGVPITIKDQFLVKGTPTSCGLAHRSKEILDEEGSLISRLRKEGAIILGKTNLPQLLVSHESNHALYGHAKNPWNHERTPGGSSGGEAAIIAAGGSPLGLGGDMGGSIRIPAHCCGISGLKPTNSRFPNDDTPLDRGYFSDLLGFEAVVVQPGPMARNVDDLKLMMDSLLKEPFDSSDSSPPVPWECGAVKKMNGLRIGVYSDNGIFSTSPAVRRVVAEAAGALRDQGCSVVDFKPPSPSRGIELYFSLLSADGGKWIKKSLAGETPIPDIKAFLMAAGCPDFMRKPLSLLLGFLGQQHASEMIRFKGNYGAGHYWSLCAERSRYRSMFLKAMDSENIDILICPPYSVAAPFFDNNASGVNSLSCTHSALFNMLGNPAGVVAAGRVREGEESDRPPSRDRAQQDAVKNEKGSRGLPVGVQVVGRHWREDQVLAVMKVLEQYFRSTRDYPAFSMS